MTEQDATHRNGLMQLALKMAGYAYLGATYINGKAGNILVAISEDMRCYAPIANGYDYVMVMDLVICNRRLEINYTGDVCGNCSIIDPNCYGQFLDALLALQTKLTIGFSGCKVLLSGNLDDLHILEVQYDLKG